MESVFAGASPRESRPNCFAQVRKMMHDEPCGDLSATRWLMEQPSKRPALNWALRNPWTQASQNAGWWSRIAGAATHCRTSWIGRTRHTTQESFRVECSTRLLRGEKPATSGSHFEGTWRGASEPSAPPIG